MGAPLAAAAIGAGATILGGMGGQAGFRASGPTGMAGFDPYAHLYGQQTHSADQLAQDAERRAGWADERTAPTIDWNLARESRAEQMRGLALARAAAEGTGPSAAQGMLRQGLDEAQGSQLGLALSARGGPGASAAAARGAQSQLAAQSARYANQAAMLRAQEQQAGLAAYMGGAAGLRGQDWQAAEFSARLRQQQQAMNDARAMQHMQLAHQIRQAQQQGRLTQQGYMMGAHTAADQTNAQISMANAKNKGFLGAIGDLF